MSRYIVFCFNRGFMFYYLGSLFVFFFVYSFMLGCRIILESRKKVKVFIIVFGSKYIVGTC